MANMFMRMAFAYGIILMVTNVLGKPGKFWINLLAGALIGVGSVRWTD